MREMIYNFSAGPAMIPKPVLEQAQAELLDWQGRGISVAEMSHRSDEFLSIAGETEKDFRDLLQIPDNYRTLFLQGGATGQFAAVPMNLSCRNQPVDYAITGLWGERAHKEAQKYVDDARVIIRTKPHTYVPSVSSWVLSKDAAYVHITPNETINGVAFSETPESEPPIVADMSSTILSEPIDVEKYGVIYAGAQKNIGPSGLTVVIAREDLFEQARSDTPKIWSWKKQAEAGSMVNTPPTVSWYIAGLVFKWLKEQGGVEAIHQVNQRKADKLYSAIDNSGLYDNPVKPENRSLTNIPFTLGKVALEKVILEEAGEQGLINLKGHRDVGGLRASIYNAMPEEGVDLLIEFMQKFERTYY